MTLLFHAPIFMLAQTRIEAMNHAFLARETEDNSKSYIMLVAIGLALLVAVCIYFWVKKRSERVVNDPNQLFRELCRAHHFSRKNRRLLFKMAREKKLANPCELLFNAELWTLDANNEQSLCHPKVRANIQKLRSMLYVPARATAEAA